MAEDARIWITVRPVPPINPKLEISITAKFDADETKALKERFGEEDFDRKIRGAIVNFLTGLCQPNA